MNIKLVKPDGKQILIDADFWEFSQGKYDNEDIVLVFYKKEDEEEEIHKPSKSGIIPKPIDTTESLKNVIGKGKLEEIRKRYSVSFTDKFESVENLQNDVITTSVYNLNDKEAVPAALKELIGKEKQLDTLLKQVETPIIILKEDDTFILQETVQFGIIKK